jgi:uncharacterized protein
MSFRKKVHYFYYRTMRHHRREREIAMGAAIGAAASCIMAPGQTVIAVVAATLTGQNKLAAALTTWISNPFTFPFFFVSTYSVGAWVLGYPLKPPEGFLVTFTHLSSIASHLLLPLLVGGAILALPLSVAVYWLTLYLVRAYRRKKWERRAKRLHRWHWHPERGWHRVHLPHSEERQAANG